MSLKHVSGSHADTCKQTDGRTKMTKLTEAFGYPMYTTTQNPEFCRRKVKLTLQRATMARNRGRGIALLFL